MATTCFEESKGRGIPVERLSSEIQAVGTDEAGDKTHVAGEEKQDRLQDHHQKRSADEFDCDDVEIHGNIVHLEEHSPPNFYLSSKYLCSPLLNIEDLGLWRYDDASSPNNIMKS